MEVTSLPQSALEGAPPTAGYAQQADGVSVGGIPLESEAILFEGDSKIAMRRLDLKPPQKTDTIIDVEWSGVSTGTERLLWSGAMPPFPGMGYPLVPGYEAVGRVVWSGDRPEMIGRCVFAPGANCYEDAYGLFGASASRIIVPSERVVPVEFDTPKNAVLLALAATGYHAIAGGAKPDLIVGHGVLGRLLVRLTVALGAPPPNVWEISPERADGDGYAVMTPEADGRNDYRAIYDVSGDAGILDDLVRHMQPRGEIVLAGFYAERPSFHFPPAFMKEIRLRVAAEWTKDDLNAVLDLINDGVLSLDGLVTHTRIAAHAEDAYSTAFEDPSCLKMVLDWRDSHGAI